MDTSTWWWLIAGAAVVAELLSGSFYLLMLSLGPLAGGLVAWLGGELPLQLATAAAVSAGAVAALHLWRKQHPPREPAQANPDVILDVGETVMVASWQGDGCAQVHYRGANWTALRRAGAPAQTGAHRVVEMQGNRLVLEPVQFDRS